MRKAKQEARLLWTLFLLLSVLLHQTSLCWSFSHSVTTSATSPRRNNSPLIKNDLYLTSQQQQEQQQRTARTRLPFSSMVLHAQQPQLSEQEAKIAIDKVVLALRKDSAANAELGRLERVTVVLGYGGPVPGSVNVRFNASFRKSGPGLSSVPLPFGLGQTNQSEGRGTMVGQVKATVNSKTGKVASCSVFRDLGYGRSFNLKV